MKSHRHWRLGVRHFGAGLPVAASTFLFMIVAIPRLRGQPPAPADTTSPSFEVASVKRDLSGHGGANLTFPPLRGRHYSASSVLVISLIEIAYDMKDYQVSGGPSWINSERYDIEADIDESIFNKIRVLSRDAQMDQIRLLLQSLLAERFNMRVTRNTKELPVYALILARDDSRLKQLAAEPNPNNPNGFLVISNRGNGRWSIEATKVPLNNFANALSVPLRTSVTNETGRTGDYTFTIRWTDDTTIPAAVQMDPAYDRTISAALQEGLGLKLKSGKGPVNTIVIDHIEEPSPN